MCCLEFFQGNRSPNNNSVWNPKLTITVFQTSANNLTWYCYLSKTRWFRKYLCMNLWKTTSKYSTWPWVEYRYFGLFWRLLVKASQSIIHRSYPKLAYGSFKTWLITGYLTRYSTWYLAWDQVTWTRSINFMTRLRLQSFGIPLDNEPRVKTPLRQYLLYFVSAYTLNQGWPLFFGGHKNRP